LPLRVLHRPQKPKSGGLRDRHCYSVMTPEKELWRLVDVGAVSPCAW
jgi:hypothetical protein